jgi:hypothetical protein
VYLIFTQLPTLFEVPAGSRFSEAWSTRAQYFTRGRKCWHSKLETLSLEAAIVDFNTPINMHAAHTQEILLDQSQAWLLMINLPKCMIHKLLNLQAQSLDALVCASSPVRPLYEACSCCPLTSTKEIFQFDLHFR